MAIVYMYETTPEDELLKEIARVQEEADRYDGYYSAQHTFTREKEKLEKRLANRRGFWNEYCVQFGKHHWVPLRPAKDHANSYFTMCACGVCAVVPHEGAREFMEKRERWKVPKAPTGSLSISVPESVDTGIAPRPYTYDPMPFWQPMLIIVCIFLLGYAVGFLIGVA